MGVVNNSTLSLGIHLKLSGYKLVNYVRLRFNGMGVVHYKDHLIWRAPSQCLDIYYFKI